MKSVIMKRFFLWACTVMLVAVGCNNETPVTPYINLSHNSLEVLFEAGSYSVAVDSNYKWSAESDSEWLLINRDGGEELNFSVLQYDGSEPRTALVTISASSITAQLTVLQLGLDESYLELVYESTDGKVVTPYAAGALNAAIVSNTYADGKGVIRFEKPLTIVGQEAFSECVTLKSITLPNSVKQLDGWAFFGCLKMVNITLSNHLTSIGDAAFSGCSALATITIPDSVVSLGETPFFGCSGLTAFYGKFASEDNRCLVRDGVLLQFASKGVTEYVIPESIRAIDAMSFYECYRLEKITFHADIESIGDNAFYYCEKLKSVYCKRVTPPVLGLNVFDNFDNGDKPIGCRFYVPKESVEAYKTAENWSRYKNYISGVDF